MTLSTLILIGVLAIAFVVAAAVISESVQKRCDDKEAREAEKHMKDAFKNSPLKKNV